MKDPSDKSWLGSEPGWDQDALSGDGGWSVSPDASSPQSPRVDHPFATEEHRRYERGALLGRGGMGRVYAALDHRLGRVVALKECAPTSHSDAVRARLTQEAWITARLEHPNIVPLHDVGVTPQGDLYYTMRLVRGRSLADAIAAAPTLQDRLPLLRHFRDACEAIAYAHSVGVVHRDLKPANIMLGSFGQTQVVDWGLARPVDGPELPANLTLIPSGHAAETTLGAVVGTPSYMAPEQAQGLPATPATDVFGLGATLFELLTGAPPLGHGRSDQILVRAREARSDTVQARLRHAPRAIAAIAQRALAPRSQERYPHAKALAQDLTAWLDGRLVDAHDYSTRELLTHFARAHRAPLLVTAIATLVFLLGGLALHLRTVTQRDRAVTAEHAAIHERQRADRTAGRALVQHAIRAAQSSASPEAEVIAVHALRLLGTSPKARGVLAGLAARPHPQRGQSIPRPPDCRRALLSPGGQSLLCLGAQDTRLYATQTGALRWRAALSGARAAFLMPAQTLLIERPMAHITALDLQTGRVTGQRTVREELGHAFLAGPQSTVAIWRHGRGIAQVTPDATITPLQSDCPKPAPALGVSPSGRHLLIACRSGRINLIDLKNGARRHVTTLSPTRLRPWPRALAAVLPPEPDIAEISTALVLPGAHFAVLGTWKGGLLYLNLDTGRVLAQAVAATTPIRSLRASPDGLQVAVQAETGGITLWSPQDARFDGRLPTSHRDAVVFGAPHTLLTLGPDTLVSWRLPAAPRADRFTAPGGISGLDWAPSGDALAVATAHSAALWDRHGRGPAPQTVESVVTKSVAFSPDGRRLYTTGVNHSLHTLDPTTLKPSAPPLPGGPTRRVAVLQNGDLLFANWGPGFRLAPGGAPQALRRQPSLGPGRALSRALSLSPDRRRAAVGYSDGLVLQIHADPARQSEVLGTVPGLQSLALANQTRTWIAATGQQVLRFVPPATDPALTLTEPAAITDIALSPNAQLIAVGRIDGRLRLYAAEGGALLLDAPAHRERISALRFAPNGATLATASWDHEVRLWSVETVRAPIATLARQVNAAWGLDLDTALSAPLR